jgi:hypothetical protein
VQIEGYISQEERRGGGFILFRDCNWPSRK